MIDEDIEAPAISRQLRRSGVSFGVSVIVHLAIFLTLALVLFTSHQNGTMTLDVSSSEDYSDMYIDDSPPLQMDAAESAVEMDDEEFEIDEDDTSTLLADGFTDPSSLMGDTQDKKTSLLPADGITVVKLAQTKGFFGIEATGNRVIYLIDNSPSMAQGYVQRRFDRAVDEVLKSVDQLRPEQEFFVFLFSHKYIPMNINGEMQFCFPTDSNKASLESWLMSASLGSGTDPREALVAALEMNPSCCFLLSDGEFNGRKYKIGKYGARTSTVSLAKKHNRGKNPIHTIGLEDKGNQKDMTKIAKQSGGVYKFITVGAR